MLTWLPSAWLSPSSSSSQSRRALRRQTRSQRASQSLLVSLPPNYDVWPPYSAFTLDANVIVDMLSSAAFRGVLAVAAVSMWTTCCWESISLDCMSGTPGYCCVAYAFIT